jgi:hypothetical protein
MSRAGSPGTIFTNRRADADDGFDPRIQVQARAEGPHLTVSDARRRAQTRRVPYRLSNRNHLVDKFERDGTTFQVPPGVVTNLIESLFFVGIHSFDLGEGA